MRTIIIAMILAMLSLAVFGATLTCEQISDASLSVPQFSSKEIEIKCAASGGTVSNIQITPNTDPSTGLTITTASTISSSISDSSSSTGKWTVTGDSPNTYTVSYIVSSSGTNSWTGASTTSVEVPSVAKLTVEYVLPPSFFTISVADLDVKISNIGGTSASNVKLQLNDGPMYDYPATIAAGSSASYSWTYETGFNSSGTYTTKAYLGSTLQDSASAVVSSSVAGNITQETGWNLISLPKVPADLAPASVFSGIVSDVDVVWGKYGTSWLKYDPDGTTTMTVMDAKKGYWVNMLSANPLNVDGDSHTDKTLELESGWNLAGFPSDTDNLDVNQTVQPIIGSLDIIWGYDGTWHKYNPANYDPNDPLHLHNFTLGSGYWYKVTEDVNLTFS